MAAFAGPNNPASISEVIELSPKEFDKVVVAMVAKVFTASAFTSLAVFMIPDRLDTTFVTESAVVSSLFTTDDREVNKVDLKVCWEAN
jgi:hypothetical protein